MLTVACASPPALAPGAQTVPTVPRSKPGMPAEWTLEKAVQAAREDAAARSPNTAVTLEVLGAEAVTWPDASIGCPAPGMVYTQALVPGFRIRLRGPLGEMDYHASTRGGLILCPPKRAVEPSRGGGINSRI